MPLPVFALCFVLLVTFIPFFRRVFAFISQSAEKNQSTNSIETNPRPNESSFTGVLAILTCACYVYYTFYRKQDKTSAETKETTKCQEERELSSDLHAAAAAKKKHREEYNIIQKKDSSTRTEEENQFKAEYEEKTEQRTSAKEIKEVKKANQELVVDKSNNSDTIKKAYPKTRTRSQDTYTAEQMATPEGRRAAEES